MKRISLFAVALSIMMATSALCQDVRFNYDKDTDFSKFKTYKWVVIKDAQQPDDITDKQIKASIDAQLSTKGLSKTDGDNADLYLAYQVAMTTEKQFTSYNTGTGGWGYGPGWYGGGWYGAGGGITTGSTSTIYVGQLALDIYDSAHKDLVWRGPPARLSTRKQSPTSVTKI